MDNREQLDLLGRSQPKRRKSLWWCMLLLVIVISGVATFVVFRVLPHCTTVTEAIDQIVAEGTPTLEAVPKSDLSSRVKVVSNYLSKAADVDIKVSEVQGSYVYVDAEYDICFTHSRCCKCFRLPVKFNEDLTPVSAFFSKLHALCNFIVCNFTNNEADHSVKRCMETNNIVQPTGSSLNTTVSDIQINVQLKQNSHLYSDLYNASSPIQDAQDFVTGESPYFPGGLPDTPEERVKVMQNVIDDLDIESVYGVIARVVEEKDDFVAYKLYVVEFHSSIPQCSTEATIVAIRE
ncbi:hypothetical protein GEMRC1_003288 [Eukaryota sp. GEM-RC1]